MPQPTDTPRDPAATAATLFVYGVFTVLLVIGCVLVWEYGRNVPHGEDWLFIPVQTGSKPVTLGWLWEQLYEHRFPLTRAMIVGMFGLGGGDLRPGMYFNLASMALVTVGLVELARRLRGATRYTDAFFPLVLMHPVNAQSSLWDQHITITAPAVLCFTLLMLVVLSPGPLRVGRAFLLGLCLLLLPLSGGWGFVAAPPMLMWAAGTACFVWRRQNGAGLLVLGVFVLATAAVMAVYFVGYVSPHDIKTSPPGQTLHVALQFLTNGFGPGAPGLWPYTGAATILLFTTTVGLLLWPLWQGPHTERARALGLLFLVGGVVLLALAAGYRRSYNDAYAGFYWRYVWSSAPWLCCAYFAWEIYGGPVLRPFVQMTLFTLAGFLVGASTPEALVMAKHFAEPMDRMEEFLKDGGANGGVPIAVFMKSEVTSVYPMLRADMWLDALPGMQRTRMGSFRHLIDDTPYREETLPLKPESAVAMTKSGRMWTGTGPDSHLVFTLTGEYVHAVQLRFSLTNASANACHVRGSWKKSPGDDAEREVQECRVDATNGITVTFWICQAVDEIQVAFDEKPFTLNLQAVKALLPGGS